MIPEEGPVTFLEDSRYLSDFIPWGRDQGGRMPGKWEARGSGGQEIGDGVQGGNLMPYSFSRV